MTPLATISTDIFSILTLVGQAFVIVSVLFFVFHRGERLPVVGRFFRNHFILLSFLVVLFGIVSSLFYSRIIGFAPCSLCVWQRWFLYPQILFFALALWKKDARIASFAGVLSVIGLGIASFHYYGQMFDTGALPCGTGGAVSSCAFTPFVSFGYITIPMMSMTAFLMLLTLLAWHFVSKRYVITEEDVDTTL